MISDEKLVVKWAVSSDEGRYTCIIKYNGGDGGADEKKTFDAFVKVKG